METKRPVIDWGKAARFAGLQLATYLLVFGSAYAAMRLVRLPPTNLTVIWFPSGFALAGMLLGLRWWAVPTIWLANWSAMAAVNGYPFFVFRPYGSLLCLVNAIQPVVGYLVWHRWLRGLAFYSGLSFLKFAAGVALLPALFTGWMVPAIIVWSGRLPDPSWMDFLLRAGITTLSNALGIILILPLIFAPPGQGMAQEGRQRHLAFGLTILSSLFTCWIAFHVSHAAIFFGIPIVLLGGILCGARGAALSTMVISVYGVLATAKGLGIFARNSEFSALFQMAAFAFSLGLPGQFAGITLDQLRRHRRNLEQQVDERTAALRQQARELATAKEAAEAADKAKSEFLAAMSHEIRTPLNSVLGFSRLLRPAATTDEQREYADSILAGGEILLALINDILDLSKIEAGAVNLEKIPFDLRKNVEQVSGFFARTAAEKHLTLSVEIEPDVPATLLGDPVRVSQIFTNLVSNAVKFTARGKVSLHVGVEERLPAAVLIKVDVTDTGIGISPGEMPRLFQRFSQADSSINRRYGGTGLGLVIVRRLCELMGGGLTVVSEKGKGSTFTARLRAEVFEGPLHAAALQAAPSAERPLRILVAEDNVLNRRLVEIFLKRLGHAVDFAEDGHQAVSLSGRGIYDAILMDVQMPGLDGLSAARQIRAHEEKARAPRVPIIALTADAMSEDRQACLAAGMDGYLSKPLDFDQLAKILSRLPEAGLA